MSKVFEKKSGYVKKILTGKYPKNSKIEFLFKEKIKKFSSLQMEQNCLDK